MNVPLLPRYTLMRHPTRRTWMRQRLAWILFSLTGSLAEREKIERYWRGSLRDINPLWSFVMKRVRTSFDGSLIKRATTWNFSYSMDEGNGRERKRRRREKKQIGTPISFVVSERWRVKIRRRGGGCFVLLIKLENTNVCSKVLDKIRRLRLSDQMRLPADRRCNS